MMEIREIQHIPVNQTAQLEPLSPDFFKEDPINNNRKKLF